MEFRILGPVEVVEDGKSGASPVKWRKNLALLVYISRAAGRSKTRDHLVGLLWADKPDAAAKHSLREARILRKQLR